MKVIVPGMNPGASIDRPSPSCPDNCVVCSTHCMTVNECRQNCQSVCYNIGVATCPTNNIVNPNPGIIIINPPVSPIIGH